MKVTQSCPTLCDPMNYTIHGILQTRILEWVTVPFSRGSSQLQVSCIAGGFFASWTTREAHTKGHIIIITIHLTFYPSLFYYTLFSVNMTATSEFATAWHFCLVHWGETHFSFPIFRRVNQGNFQRLPPYNLSISPPVYPHWMAEQSSLPPGTQKN